MTLNAPTPAPLWLLLVQVPACMAIKSDVGADVSGRLHPGVFAAPKVDLRRDWQPPFNSPKSVTYIQFIGNTDSLFSKAWQPFSTTKFKL